MAAEQALGPPRVRHRLAALESSRLNFDPAGDGPFTSARGWKVDDQRQALPPEAAGPPVPGGSWEIARRLMRGYEFADPSIVRAFYDPERPLQGRTMLLQLRYHGLRVTVGTRVGDVYEDTREQDGRRARVWGWSYDTLEGHVERGEMAWEVWKWLDTGEVQFRVHAFSRPSGTGNPFVRLGFRLIGRRERARFLYSTRQRMLALTETALRQGTGPGDVGRASAQLTARRGARREAAHDRLADRAGDR